MLLKVKLIVILERKRATKGVKGRSTQINSDIQVFCYLGTDFMAYLKQKCIKLEVTCLFLSIYIYFNKRHILICTHMCAHVHMSGYSQELKTTHYWAFILPASTENGHQHRSNFFVSSMNWNMIRSMEMWSIEPLRSHCQSCSYPSQQMFIF